MEKPETKGSKEKAETEEKSTLEGALFPILIAGCLLFILIDQPLASGICFIAAALLFLARAANKTAGFAKATGQVLVTGIKADVGKAEGSHPDPAILRRGIENAADLAGQQANAPDKYRFKRKAGLGEAGNKLIETFKKIFK